MVKIQPYGFVNEMKVKNWHKPNLPERINWPAYRSMLGQVLFNHRHRLPLRPLCSSSSLIFKQWKLLLSSVAECAHRAHMVRPNEPQGFGTAHFWCSLQLRFPAAAVPSSLLPILCHNVGHEKEPAKDSSRECKSPTFQVQTACLTRNAAFSINSQVQTTRAFPGRWETIIPFQILKV